MVLADRTTEGRSELITFERRPYRVNVVARIEFVVAQELVGGAMERI